MWMNMHNAKVENKTIIALLEIYPKKYQFQKDGNLGFKSSVSKDSINFKKYKTNGMARAVWSTHIKVKCVHMPIHIILWGESGGGTDLERGYGDVRPRRPPFHTSPAARKGPISSKRVSSQDPLLRKFDNFSLYSLNFHPNFSSQAPKFGNFQLTSPKILEIFSSQAPKFGNFPLASPLFRGKCQFASPTLRKSGPHTPTWKKVECPPPGGGGESAK